MSDASPRGPCVPLVLAAGASSRMGRPKAGLAFGERSALRLILDACAEAGLGPAVVVAGADPGAADAWAAGALRPPQVVHNLRWESGRATSIQVGLEAIPEHADALLLWPVDACLVRPATLEGLLRVWRRSRGSGPWLAWVPSSGGRRGHPLLVQRDAWPRFAALSPDEPARKVVRQLAQEGALCHVEVGDPEVLMNMNTPEDYQAALGRWRARQGGDDLGEAWP